MKTRCAFAFALVTLAFGDFFLMAGPAKLPTAPPVSATSKYQMSGAFPVDAVLSLYSLATGRKVWIALGVRTSDLVNIELREATSIEDVLALLRKALLEQKGIDVRDSEKGDTFVSWTSDPQYTGLANPVLEPYGQDPALTKRLPAERRRVRVMSKD